MSINNASNPAPWLTAPGPDQDVVISSRARIARNIEGFPFVNAADTPDLTRVVELTQHALDQSKPALPTTFLDLETAGPVRKQLLVERHLISSHHAKRDHPRAVAFDQAHERLSIMVNEEDHLRIQVVRPGLDLHAAYTQLDSTEQSLEHHFDFAYSQRLGYLTACPTNVGTAVRFSVMLHLPALAITGDLDKVQNAAKAMSMAVRGAAGEGSESEGHLFQLSNQTTLGKSEQQLLEAFQSHIIPQVVEFERAARRTLLDRRRLVLEDRVHRARAVLASARLLEHDECTALLSDLRLGVASGIIDTIDLHAVTALLLMAQPGHLQHAVGRTLDQSERKVERANLCRRALTNEQ